MRHASLFSGIGGFDLAAEWAGWENVFHCEWNPFGQRVLKHHFPKSISYNDITKTDFSIHANQIDIITGGFPCQPYSSAGKRLGKSDKRHLFPEMLRAIKEIKPRWVIGENVRGLISWNEGMVFHEVYDDLEREGYEVQSFLIPAASVGAPHQRYRVWFIAYNAANSISFRLQHSTKEREIRTEEKNAERERNKFALSSKTNGNGYKPDWQNFPTVSPICAGNDGLSKKLDRITFSKWRKESIQTAGNAIVPQVAYQLFKTINEFEYGINA